MKEPAHYDRNFFTSGNAVTRIGSGSLGGKAQGLLDIGAALESGFGGVRLDKIEVSIPRMAVIATDYFDEFVAQAGLLDTACSDLPDDRIAEAFQRADLPPRLVGDLRALAAEVHTPLAVRSSSLLEDAMYEPFAGVYGTKMIPNNQPSADERFRKLASAVKFVWASTFFAEAKKYIRLVKRDVTDEKMAVIVQEVVGQQFGQRFYPHLSGVARSYNFYPSGRSSPADGVVDLALGMGKTIVDGERSWSYSPANPQSPPPFNDVSDLMKNTQNDFWAVNMGKPPAYNPLRETEYMIKASLEEAEYDNTLRYAASTYNPRSDRIVPGTGPDGPRVLNFAPILVLNEIKINDVIQELLSVCEAALETEVEIEFAMTFDRRSGLPARLGFLQVRPMVVSHERVDMPVESLMEKNVILASENALGNGRRDDIKDVVYLMPDVFDSTYSRQIAMELDRMNNELVTQGRPYLLIGFGRFGTSDPWCGIPVTWAQISGARAIVEATLPGMETEPSQGSHFFHNVTSFKVFCFSLKHSGRHAIDWEWLESQRTISNTQFVRHVRTASPLTVIVDGRSNRGLIMKQEQE